ncbi:hypothetical protein [Fusobacterium sp.]|uniref:hypothetical protein n=1 Tax=Fusobacterium sp. TaxID=68766 RepID=UPI00396C5C74
MVEIFKEFVLVNNIKIEITKESFLFKNVETDEILEELKIKQSDIEKAEFKNQNISKIDIEDRIELFSHKQEEILKKLNIFKN